MGILGITNGEALIDDELLSIVGAYNWYKSSHGYAVSTVNGKQILMHRFIMGAKGDDVVDHKNGNKLDNRKENLRFVTRSQNSQNCRKPMNKTGFIGVAYDKGTIKAHVRINGKRFHLGTFKSEIEAAKVYDAKALEVFGPDARTNVKLYQEILEKLEGKK